MDSVSQRRLAAAAFVIVWAIKIPLLLSADVHHFGLACIIDAVFFVALHRATIPWMNMSKCGTLLLILGSWILNMGLLGSQTADELVKTQVKESQTMTQGNIVGSHVVHVRPPTIVKLNPNASTYCASKDQIPKLNVLIKGSPPWILEVDHAFEGKISKFNLTVDSLNLTDSTLKVGSKSYAIQVNRIGIFQISAIYEAKTGDIGKVIPSSVEIAKCPEAKWKTLSGMDVCEESVGNVDVILQGIPPLSVWILKKYPSSSPVIDLISIGSIEDGYGTFSTSMKIPIQKLKNVELKILRVADGKHNTIDYGIDDELIKSLPQINSKSSYYMLETLSEFLITARPLPTVRFSNCKSSQKLKVDERNRNHTSMLRLPLKVSGNGPFKIHYKRQLDTEQKSESFDYDVESDFIEADTQGTYLLSSIHDSFCKGIILEPSSCDVIATFPPTISVASTPIESACIGAIGLTANLSFTGDPPFWMDVQEELLETNFKKIERYENLKSRHIMRFEPSDGNGTYRYSFLKVRVLSNFPDW
jgi:nucleoporin POM152